MPKSVQGIGDEAFWICHNLHSLIFEEGSRLAHVGKDIVGGTQVDLKKVRFPNMVQIDNNNNAIRRAFAEDDME